MHPYHPSQRRTKARQPIHTFTGCFRLQRESLPVAKYNCRHFEGEEWKKWGSCLSTAAPIYGAIFSGRISPDSELSCWKHRVYVAALVNQHPQPIARTV